MLHFFESVIHNVTDSYNKKCSRDQEKILSSIDSFDFITTLNKYPQLFEINHNFDSKSTNVLNDLRKEYAKNRSLPKMFLKTINRIQNTVYYLAIFETYLIFYTSNSTNDRSNKGK